jgi:hypothetical protein
VARQELERERAAAMANADDYTCDPLSADEACGFEDGFVDYVIYGGNGTPPLPPRRYWKSNRPNGYQAIQDWYNGFRHGAAVAQASGYRECVTIPLSDGLNTNVLPYYVGQQSGLEYAESYGPFLGSTDDDEHEPETLNVSAPELRTADSQSAGRLSEPDLNSPPRPKPEIEHFPIIKSPASPPIIDREQQVVPLSQSWPAFSSGVEAISPTGSAASTGVRLASATEPDSPGEQVVPIATEPLSFKSLPPLSDDQGLPGANQPVAIPSSQPAPIKRIPAKSETGLFSPQPAATSPEQQALMSWLAPESEEAARDLQAAFPAIESFAEKQATFVEAASCCDPEPTNAPAPKADTEGETASQGEKLTIAPKTNSGASPLWPIIAGVASLLAGMIYLVRFQPQTAALVMTRFRHLSRQTPWGSGSRLDAGLPGSRDGGRQQHDVHTRVGVATRAKIGMMIVAMLGCMMSGCAALTNPVLNGIPVRKLPDELLSAPNRDRLQTIPLSLLRQKQPDEYILAAGDVIGVFVAGVFPLTSPEQPLPTPPVYFPSQIDPLGKGLPPSLGYPVTIRNDGTLALPFVEPVKIDGLSIEEANVRIREAYLDKGILQSGREEVLVTLMQPRQIRILVFRQEVGGFSSGGRGDITGNNKLGTGHIVDLRAYENDVVTALANTGGLPGLDAFDGVYIFRGGQTNPALVDALPAVQSGEQLHAMSDFGIKVDFIPTRWASGEPLPFSPEDAILNEGDIVFLESRINDVYYTGGLLPSGQQVLPRDYDLDVIEAIAQVNGTLVNGAFGGNNFNGLLIQQGIGNPNPSALTVIRRTPDGGQIPIFVDLNRALVDARERILVRPNDVLILQETGWEAIARYFGNAITFNVTVFQSGSGAATATGN